MKMPFDNFAGVVRVSCHRVGMDKERCDVCVLLIIQYHKIHMFFSSFVSFLPRTKIKTHRFYSMNRDVSSKSHCNSFHK